MKSFDQQVADWARTKPADEAYDYEAPGGCALCQFLRETGMAKDPWVAPLSWSDLAIPCEERPDHRIEERLADVLIADGYRRNWTFGALADRLSS